MLLAPLVAVGLAIAFGFLYIDSVGSEGFSFHAQITSVSPRRIGYDTVDQHEFRTHMCDTPEGFFYEHRPVVLAVGDCVMLSSSHPLIIFDQKVPHREFHARRAQSKSSGRSRVTGSSP